MHNIHTFIRSMDVQIDSRSALMAPDSFAPSVLESRNSALTTPNSFATSVLRSRISALSQNEVHACSGWLEREISEVSPRVIVALGATAIRAVCGLSVTVEEARRSELRSVIGSVVVTTYHPSAILRALEERRGQLLGMLIEDLGRAGREAAVLGEETSRSR